MGKVAWNAKADSRNLSQRYLGLELCVLTLAAWRKEEGHGRGKRWRWRMCVYLRRVNKAPQSPFSCPFVHLILLGVRPEFKNLIITLVASGLPKLDEILL